MSKKSKSKFTLGFPVQVKHSAVVVSEINYLFVCGCKTCQNMSKWFNQKEVVVNQQDDLSEAKA